MLHGCMTFDLQFVCHVSRMSLIIIIIFFSLYSEKTTAGP